MKGIMECVRVVMAVTGRGDKGGCDSKKVTINASHGILNRQATLPPRPSRGTLVKIVNYLLMRRPFI